MPRRRLQQPVFIHCGGGAQRRHRPSLENFRRYRLKIRHITIWMVPRNRASLGCHVGGYSSPFSSTAVAERSAAIGPSLKNFRRYRLKIRHITIWMVPRNRASLRCHVGGYSSPFSSTVVAERSAAIGHPLKTFAAID